MASLENQQLDGGPAYAIPELLAGVPSLSRNARERLEAQPEIAALMSEVIVAYPEARPEFMDPAVMEKGNCINTTVDMCPPTPLTFKGEALSEYQRDIERAKAVCVGCPVVRECLRTALIGDSQGGVWGGLSESQRKDMHKIIFYRRKMLAS